MVTSREGNRRAVVMVEFISLRNKHIKQVSELEEQKRLSE